MVIKINDYKNKKEKEKRQEKVEEIAIRTLCLITKKKFADIESEEVERAVEDKSFYKIFCSMYLQDVSEDEEEMLAAFLQSLTFLTNMFLLEFNHSKL